MVFQRRISLLSALFVAAAVFVLFSRSTEGEPMSDCIQYSGMCDASAAVALDNAMFIVADDESNTLCIYSADRPGPPDQRLPWDAFLGIDSTKKDPPEADIEGAAVLDGRIYWITSHGRNKDGTLRPGRQRFFAMEVVKAAGGWEARPFGAPYEELAERLVAAPTLRHLELEKSLRSGDKKSKRLAPKKEGLNIEGLCAVPESGTLLIALRNPRPDGKALLVPLLNPAAVLAEEKPPHFGDPILLDLSFERQGERFEPGIRSISYSPRHEGYLIIAGPHDEEKVFAAFRWSGRPGDSPVLLRAATDALNGPEAFCPEALIVYPQGGKIQVLSDDGSRKVKVGSAAECEKGAFKNGECEAKFLLDPRRRTFRSMILKIDESRRTQ